MRIENNGSLQSKVGKFHMDTADGSIAEWEDINLEIEDGKVYLLVWDKHSLYYVLYIESSSGTYTVNWGDGIIETVDSGVCAIHTYERGTGKPCSGGYTTFKITISGDLTAFRMGSRFEGTDRFSQYTEYGVLGAVINSSTLQSLSKAFGISDIDELEERVYTCPNLRFVRVLKGDSITTISEAFSYCGVELLDLSGLSAVQNIDYAFFNCKKLKTIDLSPMTQVTSAMLTFSGCDFLEEVRMGNKPLLQNTDNMFYQCALLNKIDLSGLTATQSCICMFFNCSNLKEVDLSGMGSVLNATQMLEGCSKIRKVDISAMTNLQIAQSMFSGCSSLEEISLLGLTSLTNTNYMFMDTAIKHMDLSELTSLIEAGFMFSGCLHLKDAIVGNLPTLTSAYAMFIGCQKLESIDISGLGNVESFTRALQGCTNLREVTMGTYPNCKDTSMMFGSCQRLESVNLDGFTATETVYYMFGGCLSLKEIMSDSMGINSLAEADGQDFFSDCPVLERVIVPNLKLAYLSSACKGQYINTRGVLETLVLGQSTYSSAWPPNISLRGYKMSGPGINSMLSSLPSGLSSKAILLKDFENAGSCDIGLAPYGWTVNIEE